MPETRELPHVATAGTPVPFELQLLFHAHRYQSWVFDTIQPYLGKRILEIGAGVGNMSRWLPLAERLILTEAEPELLTILRRNVAEWRAPPEKVTTQAFDVMADPLDRYVGENLDTIVSFNVLEHVRDDVRALTALCEILRTSNSASPKRLVTFVPAHDWAYGSLDETFGHWRRYSAREVRRIAARVAPEARLTLRHFNLFGLFGWLLQGRVLKRTRISINTVRSFEMLCPYLRPIDDFLHGKLKLPVGQSLLAVLEWDPEPRA